MARAYQVARRDEKGEPLGREELTAEALTQLTAGSDTTSNSSCALRHFPPGTTLSVPTYSVHHSREIWGPDADEFRPERWEEVTEWQKNALIPFSYGPRACIGHNVADVEMAFG
ncbi:cytochrome P450 [Sodiomyces alkalinus F11]|uniref:Cytochrome P450 n=1 Tax=Sodiomyces alkalinus (strain CBS 110278 / VKM F-3762 / F11) TaxID=1314773 RepID=A0A3N2PRM1_SODAK|nr:cytochrome P450 [Sodiomyces alkalinus F11]ROT37147.1 cytochrome P450 [Sodiomyces alkalinus F11]